MGRLTISVIMAGMLVIAVVAARGENAVVVGAIYPTGGAQGPGGLEEYRGVGLAAQYVNRRGGVHGRPIRLRLEPADSADATPGAIARLEAGITVVVGSYGSTISRPVAEFARRRGLVFWETGAVGDLTMEAAASDRVFRFVPTGTSLGHAAVTFIRDQVIPRVANGRMVRYTVVYVDDVYGRSVARGAITEIQTSGLLLAAALPYRLPRVDYEHLAGQVARVRTDVLVVAAYLEDGIALRRAIVRRGVPLLASIGTSSSYCMPEFGRALGRDAVGLFASDKPDGDVVRLDRLTPEAAEALRWAREEYRRSHGSAMPAPALSGFAGGLALFGHVLPAARDLSPAAVAGAARALRLPVGSLPNGSGLAFPPPEDSQASANLRATSVIWQWVRPNTRAVVWPASYATELLVSRVDRR